MAETQTNLAKSYVPAEHESDIRGRWEESGAFHAEPDASVNSGVDRAGNGPAREGGASGGAYCILIPPPNVTAALHLGHAFNNSLQDILVRYHRMRGFNTLWMPGTDHAGIATQAVVEKRLAQEGKRRTDFSREEFIALVQQWKDEYEATITEQLKVMGCSCDWERQRFTMDEMCAKAVREAFFRLFKDGLIYRGKRLVNWDPVSQTALADDEVEDESVQGAMYYLRYPLVHLSTNANDPKDCQEVTWSELFARGYPRAGLDIEDDEQNAWITVATTRPETYLGDTAVAVNPKDPRAGALKGLCVQLPIVGRVIPIITDDYVVLPDANSSEAKAQYATGFLKVTPAHDPNDWTLGVNHHEEIATNSAGEVVINVMAPDASISDQHGWQREAWNEDGKVFVGLTREAAREKVLAEFKARNLLENIRQYTHTVGHSYRSHVPIEPYLSDQWYVKVTDDRMKGEALRALDDEQYDGAKPTREETSRDHKGAIALTSRDREGADRAERQCYFLSYTCYGNWLHGDDRGSVDRDNNIPGTPVLIGDETRERKEFESLKFPPMELSTDMREVVQEAIKEVCAHRGWVLLALHVRPKHLHTVVIADVSPERAMIDFKAYATRRLRERGLVDDETRVWTRHGSTRYINDEPSMLRAADYVIDEQGSAMRPSPVDGRGVLNTPNPLPHGRGSLGNESAGDGGMRFYPARYAKTYQQWHENLRDWCISRQLWWGHRIPVWHKQFSFADRASWMELDQINVSDAIDGDGGLAAQVIDSENGTLLRLPFDAYARGEFQGRADVFVCLREDNPGQIHPPQIKLLEQNGWKQDPDVLDTWFSSGLWPLSTMGWPTPAEYPDTNGLLDTFNPTSVLCTAREIITLWVSRMTMFNRYFMADKRVPFKHVYIHAMIQDGHGQKMSKSLGNGVDPRDIIHSHGADAMRYTLTQMATQTQDVRLPVDLVCPHCKETFHPKEFTDKAGYTVAMPTQTCPKCNKKMTSPYGAATGVAKPSGDAPLARTTSSKFDLGRNFCNKLWNATRFALTYLSNGEAHALQSVGFEDLTLPDRWIIARLHRTLHIVEDALADYQFAAYAEAMYDFIWRDFCDWYLEVIKPTVKDDPNQQQVLRTVLNAAVRMLHPICPFVTEALWPHIAATGAAGLNGIKLPHAPHSRTENELLTVAPWPSIKCSVEDKEAVKTFERLQTLTGLIRNLRAERNVPQKKKITFHTTKNVQRLLHEAPGTVETLAGLESVEMLIENRPAGSIPFAFEGEEHLLSGLVDEVDVEVERTRLTKLIEEKSKAIAALNGRLSNEAYVAKAPPALVEESRAKLAEANSDLEAARRSLESLGMG